MSVVEILHVEGLVRQNMPGGGTAAVTHMMIMLQFLHH